MVYIGFDVWTSDIPVRFPAIDGRVNRGGGARRGGGLFGDIKRSRPHFKTHISGDSTGDVL